MGQLLAEKINQRHQDQPGEDAAGEDDARHAQADDVADAEVLRGGVGLDRGPFQDVLGAEIRLEFGSARPGAEEIFILEEGVDRAQAEAEEDAAGQRPSALAGDQHIGAGRALGVSQVAVLFDDQLAAQGNHEQHAQPAADQGQQEDAGVLEVKAEKNQRGQGEDDPGGDRLTGVASGLDNVVFQNRGPTEGAQNADREHRDGNRSGHREAGSQAHVNRDGAKNNAEKRAQQQGAEGEFGTALLGRNKRLKDGEVRLWHG
jgi:hypothetical protein